MGSQEKRQAAAAVFWNAKEARSAAEELKWAIATGALRGNECAPKGCSLLLKAVWEKNHEAVSTLLGVSGLVDKSSVWGWGPLHCAASAGAEGPLGMELAKAGADLWKKDALGWRPSDWSQSESFAVWMEKRAWAQNEAMDWSRIRKGQVALRGQVAPWLERRVICGEERGLQEPRNQELEKWLTEAKKALDAPISESDFTWEQ